MRIRAAVEVLTPLIASYGFSGAAPPHPGNTLAEFPACGSGAAQAASIQERPNDIIFVTDQLLAANADNTSPFFGAIDPDRIGMSGHSFGGLTTYLVSALDARYKIAVPMAPAALFTPTLTVPSLTMMGAIDSVVNNVQTRAAYDRSSAPKMKVEISHAGHFAFSDGCFPTADCNPPTTLTQDEAHQQVLRWVVPFLRRYLAEDMSAEPLLDSTLPGVSVVQDRGGARTTRRGPTCPSPWPYSRSSRRRRPAPARSAAEWRAACSGRTAAGCRSTGTCRSPGRHKSRSPDLAHARDDLRTGKPANAASRLGVSAGFI
jgi:predicted dienelactone hydrolase